MDMKEQLDEIRIEGLEVFAHHGVFPREKEEGQNFYVNATLYCDLRRPGMTDDLKKSTHYGEVSMLINQTLKEHTFDLIEKAAETAARKILLTFPLIQGIDFELRKPNAPIPLAFQSVSVRIKRSWHKVYIAYGSNMGDSLAHIERGIKALGECEDMRILRQSQTIQTKPYGGVKQDDFYNGVIEAKTLLTPYELLDKLHEIEALEERVRIVHWGPRTLDLDILFYDDLILGEKDLQIPHIDLVNREFVLKPMATLAPYYRHPVNGHTMEELLQKLGQ